MNDQEKTPSKEGLAVVNAILSHSTQSGSKYWLEQCALLVDAHVAEQTAALRKALQQATQQEFSMARRMRAAIVEARRRLAKGRVLWNGPCHECDAVLEQALTAECPAREDSALRAAADAMAEAIEYYSKHRSKHTWLPKVQTALVAYRALSPKGEE